MMAGDGGDKPPDDPEKIAKEMQMAASKGASANKTNGKRTCIQTGPIDAKKICVGLTDPMLGQAEHTLSTLNQLHVSHVQSLVEEVDAATDGPRTPGSTSSSRDPLAAAMAAHTAAKTQWAAAAVSPGQCAPPPPDPPAAAQRPPALRGAVSPEPPAAAQMPPPWQAGTLSLQEQVNRIEKMQATMAAIMVRGSLNNGASQPSTAAKSVPPHPRAPHTMPGPPQVTPPALAPGTLPPPRMAPPTHPQPPTFPPCFSRATPVVMHTPTSTWTIPPGGIIGALLPESLPTEATAAAGVPPGAAGTGDAPDAIRALTEAVIKAIADARATAAAETTGTTDQSTPPEEHPTQTPPTQAAEDHAATPPAQAAEDQPAETGRCLLFFNLFNNICVNV